MRVVQVNHPQQFASTTSWNTIPQLLQREAGTLPGDSRVSQHVHATTGSVRMGKCGTPLAIALLVLFLVTLVVKASPLIRIQLCGTELANKLAEMCSPHGYNDPFSHALRFESPPVENRAPLRLRVRRGVADECCKSGCTLDTMEQYCSSPLTSAERSRFIQKLRDNRMNHIPQDDAAAGDSLPESLEMRSSGNPKEHKNDLISKVRGQHDKKLRRGNNRCRCRRRRRRGKGDIEELDIHQNQIRPVIGTINPSYLGIPIILSPRIRKDEIHQDFKIN